VTVDKREMPWLDTMEVQIDSIPDDEEEFISKMISSNTSDKFSPAKYDL
jgi:methanol--5-hydroxybenzimidazolylcobamide Co-methyltransferase